MPRQWFYEQGDDRLGPISSKQLKELAASGRITSETLVRQDSSIEWVEAGRVCGLFADEKPGSAGAAAVPEPPPETGTAAAREGRQGEAAPRTARRSTNWEQHSAQAKQALHQAGREAKEASAATWSHAAKAVRYATLRWKERSLQKAAADARLDLGETLYRKGLGDERFRKQIAELDDRIESIRAGNGSTKMLEVERRGLLVRLAAQAEAHPETGPERAALERAEQALAEHRSAVATTGEALRPQTYRQGVQVAAGYACVLLLLALVLWPRGGGRGVSLTERPAPEGGEAVPVLLEEPQWEEEADGELAEAPNAGAPTEAEMRQAFQDRIEAINADLAAKASAARNRTYDRSNPLSMMEAFQGAIVGDGQVKLVAFKKIGATKATNSSGYIGEFAARLSVEGDGMFARQNRPIFERYSGSLQRGMFYHVDGRWIFEPAD